MTDQPWQRRHIVPFWDDEYKLLDYQREPFNDPVSLNEWKKGGYTQKHFVGKMADIRKEQPSWNKRFIEYFGMAPFGWNAVSTSYYVMETGVILPAHKDLYVRYKEVHELYHYEDIWRAVIFLEDRQDGHVFEIAGETINWKAGDTIIWKNDVEHLAANIGLKDRYTLQITGWTPKNGTE